MKNPFDVAVIGAGLAGLQCARELARRGLTVLLADRKGSLAAPVHTTGIFVRKTWEDFPLPDEQLGAPIRDVVLYSPSRRTLHLTADTDEFRIGRMSLIYLHLLDECARLGVRWMPSSTLVACDATSITLARRRPAGGADAGTGDDCGATTRIPVRFVVGADGTRSAVARLFNLGVNRDMLVGVEEIVPAVDPEPALHCFLDPRLAPGYIAWVANDGEEAHVGVAGNPHRFAPAAALRELRASLPFPIGKAAERRGGLIPVGGMPRRIACERALLVGDAAGAVSPLTAGGLDGAMRLSVFAAEVIAAYLDAGDARVLQQYSASRFRTRFLVRSWMRRALEALSHPLALELGCALLRTPPLQRIAEHVFFARGSFPDVRPHRIRACSQTRPSSSSTSALNTRS